MSDFQIKPATRQALKSLTGFYGKSGSGKTMSALLFARGLAGPNGKVRLIDSESGRGSIFSDLIPGGYDVIELDAPFSPDRYTQALELAEKDSEVVVTDTLSHEWSGEGGILDWQEAELDRMAGDNWSKREACKMAAWIKPKMAHKLMVQRLLRSKVHLICCLRGEEKTHISKKGGKTEVYTDEFSSPLFDPRFIFEMLVNFETVARDGVGGYVIPRKITHPAIRAFLPAEGEQISVKHGEAIAAWCRGEAKGPAASQPANPSTTTTKTATGSLKGQLWALRPDPGMTAPGFQQWLWDEMLMATDSTMGALPEADLLKLIGVVKRKLNK